MADKVATLKTYHNGSVLDIANIYNSSITGAAISGHLKVFHNNSTFYIPLSNDNSLKKTPCLNVYHSGKAYFALMQSKLNISATPPESITYNTTGIITISGYQGDGAISATVNDNYTDCLAVQSVTSDAITVKVNNCSENPIPVTVNVEPTADLTSATATCNIVTQKAELSPFVLPRAPFIIYGESFINTIYGNSGGGTVTATSANTDYFVVESTTTNTVTIKCTKHLSAGGIRINYTIAETKNYNAYDGYFSVWTKRADISPEASANAITYNSTGSINVTGNLGSGTVTATIPDAYSDCLTVTNTSTDTVSLACTKYTADTIPVTIKIARTNNYNSATCVCSVTTAQASLPSSMFPTASIDGPVAYGSTGFINISGTSSDDTISATSRASGAAKIVDTSYNTVAITPLAINTLNIIDLYITPADSNYKQTRFASVQVRQIKGTPELSTSINNPVTYNSTATISVIGNSGKAYLGASVDSNYTDCLKVQSITTDTVKVKCTKYTADTIPVTINAQLTTYYYSATTVCNVTTAKADISPTASITDPVTYNSTGIISISGNVDSGTVTATSGDTSCLTIQSTTSNTVTVKCTKYKSSAIPVTINIASTDNYASGTATCNVSTKKATLNLQANNSSVIYNSTTTIAVTNAGGGTLTATSADTSCVTVQSTTSSTVKVKCVKYSANPITITVNAPATNNYYSATTTCSVTTRSADASLSVSDTSVTYNSTTTIAVTGNNGGGTLTATVPNAYSSCLTVQSTTSSTVTVKCTNVNAKNIPVTITCPATANYSSDSVVCNVTTNPILLTKPTFYGGSTFTYDGAEHYATVKNLDSDTMYISMGFASESSVANMRTTTPQTNAGTYHANVALKNTTNYHWADGSTAFVQLSWVINKKTLTVPTLSATSFTYDKSQKTVTVKGFDSDTMFYDGDSTFKATDAGEYWVGVWVKDSTNYKFSVTTNGFDDTYTLNWKINPASVTIPTVSGTFTYNGESKSPTISNFNSTLENKSGDESAVNADTYSITFSLKDNSNYRWSDGTTADITKTWTINKAGMLPAATDYDALTGWYGNPDISANSIRLGALNTNCATYGEYNHQRLYFIPPSGYSAIDFTTCQVKVMNDWFTIEYGTYNITPNKAYTSYLVNNSSFDVFLHGPSSTGIYFLDFVARHYFNTGVTSIGRGYNVEVTLSFTSPNYAQARTQTFTAKFVDIQVSNDGVHRGWYNPYV